MNDNVQDFENGAEEGNDFSGDMVSKIHKVVDQGVPNAFAEQFSRYIAQNKELQQHTEEQNEIITDLREAINRKDNKLRERNDDIDDLRKKLRDEENMGEREKELKRKEEKWTIKELKAEHKMDLKDAEVLQAEAVRDSVKECFVNVFRPSTMREKVWRKVAATNDGITEENNSRTQE